MRLTRYRQFKLYNLINIIKKAEKFVACIAALQSLHYYCLKLHNSLIILAVLAYFTHRESSELMGGGTVSCRHAFLSNSDE